ncbi:putative sulfonate biosynthesis enzyme [Zopfia rhizophila CBS 207.26]|uniref:Putative sulfonate biosynthesis enzyme n=1 Tax=Zopfia rhizophila CBS 207.26 TaxID=1314779 RepID=A0A6A6D6T3_9PEZI|nr:putative sulfonate biosynthesis enzyme [Zopfia rhizophila CBS 207.26]
MGPNYLSDVLKTMGSHVDGLKFAGGSFSRFPEEELRKLLDLTHLHNVYVSTGGWMEHILSSADPGAGKAVDKYLAKCKDLRFNVIEISSGFLSLPDSDWLRLVDRVHKVGLKAKPKLGIQFGAGGDTEASDLESMRTSDPSKVINMAKQFISAGVERMMIESDSARYTMEMVMFEAAELKVFNWYIREFGVDVNLFVDHSQIVQLTCLRKEIWGMADKFRKVVSDRSGE